MKEETTQVDTPNQEEFINESYLNKEHGKKPSVNF